MTIFTQQVSGIIGLNVRVQIGPFQPIHKCSQLLNADNSSLFREWYQYRREIFTEITNCTPQYPPGLLIQIDICNISAL